MHTKLEVCVTEKELNIPKEDRSDDVENTGGPIEEVTEIHPDSTGTAIVMHMHMN